MWSVRQWLCQVIASYYFYLHREETRFDLFILPYSNYAHYSPLMLFLRVTSPSNFSYSLRITSLHFILFTLLQSHLLIILQRRGFSRILSEKWATKIQGLWRKILAKRSVSQRRIEVAAGGVLLRTLFYYQCR